MTFLTQDSESYSILDIGYDKNLMKISDLDLVLVPEMSSVFEEAYIPRNIPAGELITELNLVVSSLLTGSGANAGGIAAAEVASDIVFWAGATFADRTTAPFRVDAAGNITATTLVLEWPDVSDTAGLKPSDNATVGATFNVNISGGGVANTQISDAGFASLFRQDKFGDANTGTVTISSNTTLTADVYYNNLTINSNITLTTNGYRVFVQDTLTNNGTIANAVPVPPPSSCSI